MKIAFYLDNEKHIGVDYSNPKGGNPGIGGTQYMIWTVSYYIQQIYSDIEVIVLAPIIDKLPLEIKSYQSDSIIDAVKISKELDVDILVFRDVSNNKKIYDEIDRLQINCIRWAHNYDNEETLKNVSKCKYIKRNVCVSREQYDSLRDHDVFIKSTYIYNCLDFEIYNKYINNDREKKNIVCYMGALEPEKGFHTLAKCWPKVVKEVPDAQLYIIGSGKLYNRNAKLGEYGLTEKKYEKKIVKYLVNPENKKIYENVKFLGVLGGNEKLNVMSQCKVGIANVSKNRETFCIVATEFQALGIPVIARNSYGFLDSISNNRSGVLVNNERELYKSIIKLLKDNQLNLNYGEYGIEFVKEKFDIYDISKNWVELFNDVINNSQLEINYKAQNYFNDYKWLREINRIFKLKSMPSILWYEFKLKKIKRYFYNNLKNIM